jgi:inhibitor of KinA sporulation pathway (predicted exonuclease)
MRNQNYFSLDLELNNKNDGTVPKIIQVGVAIGNPTQPDNIKTYSWYLNPQEPITPFITNLTGITDEMVQTQSVSHSDLAEELGSLIKENDCFQNPITWGQNDAEELKDEFRSRNIDFPFFGRRIIDVKTVYVFYEMVNGRSPSGGLSKSMGRYKLPFIGKSHRADVDALNTLRFYFYLMSRQKTLETCMSEMKSISY